MNRMGTGSSVGQWELASCTCELGMQAGGQEHAERRVQLALIEAT